MSCVRHGRLSQLHVRTANAATTLSELRKRRSARAYVLRHGVAHALAAGQVDTARVLLEDFAWLQARVRDLTDQAAPLVQDAGATLKRLPPDARPSFAPWETFFRDRVHLLSRGDAAWPADRILLQLAVEHADDSPVTRAAEAWLATGACDWVWLRRVRVQRPHTMTRTGQVAVMSQPGPVRGVVLLGGGRILSWSDGPELRIWSPRGALLATLDHMEAVNGALELPCGHLLSWSWDGTIRRWDEEGECVLKVETAHRERIEGMRVLPDGRWLSWGGSLTLWQPDGESFATLHDRAVRGALVLADGRLVAWCDDGTILVWYADGERYNRILAHDAPVCGVVALQDSALLSWSLSRDLYLWNPEGDRLAVLAGHLGWVIGALALPDGRIVSWAEDGALRVWSASGAEIAELVGHTAHVTSVRLLDPSTLLSASRDGDVRVWRNVPVAGAVRPVDGPSDHAAQKREMAAHDPTAERARQAEARALRTSREPGTRRLRDYL